MCAKLGKRAGDRIIATFTYVTTITRTVMSDSYAPPRPGPTPENRVVVHGALHRTV